MPWLYGALLRCAKSICYTKKIRERYPIKPALFTGRRTGGLLFILLQNMMFEKYVPDPLGTSSVDSYVILKKLGYPCAPPSGTHAHELSMVTSILFPGVDMQNDKNPYNLPLTQVISHYLYYENVWKKTGGPMPMLPDTLGTPAFLRAASYITVDDQPFLNKITFARQDSGELGDFIANLNDYKKGTIGKMASEIDSVETLYKAAELGYETFGAGGFFGDSEKVWGDPKASSNSMAVKAVRVTYYAADIPASLPPNTKVEGSKITGYPIKLGDPDDRTNPVLKPGKLSLDKNLDPSVAESIKKYAEQIRILSAPGSGEIKEHIELRDLVPEIFSGKTSGGRRGRGRTRGRSRRNRRTKKKNQR